MHIRLHEEKKLHVYKHYLYTGNMKAKNISLDWRDPDNQEVHKLKFCRDESAETRAMGAALHYLYDAVAKIILPLAPSGARVSTNKPKGIIQLVIGRRYYPLLQIWTSAMSAGSGRWTLASTCSCRASMQGMSKAFAFRTPAQHSAISPSAWHVRTCYGLGSQG